MKNYGKTGKMSVALSTAGFFLALPRFAPPAVLMVLFSTSREDELLPSGDLKLPKPEKIIHLKAWKTFKSFEPTKNQQKNNL